MTTVPKRTIEMPEDSEKSNEPKRERCRKRERGSRSKTDEETNHSADMICGQHGDQADHVEEQTSAVRFEEINRKLDKLLALCPLIEDLKTHLQRGAVKGRKYRPKEIITMGDR